MTDEAPCGCLAVKFDSCNSLLSSVHTLLVNILRCVRLYIKGIYIPCDHHLSRNCDYMGEKMGASLQLFRLSPTDYRSTFYSRNFSGARVDPSLPNVHSISHSR